MAERVPDDVHGDAFPGELGGVGVAEPVGVDAPLHAGAGILDDLLGEIGELPNALAAAIDAQSA